MGVYEIKFTRVERNVNALKVLKSSDSASIYYCTHCGKEEGPGVYKFVGKEGVFCSWCSGRGEVSALNPEFGGREFIHARLY